MDYLLPEGLSVASAERALADRFELRNGRLGQTDRVYYDTFDGLLHGAGLMAIHDGDALALVGCDDERVRASVPIARPTKPLLASDLPASAVRNQLSPLIDVRALLPVAQLRTRERPLDVLNRERKTVVRMRLAQPRVGRTRLPPRLQVRPVRGYEKALHRVNRALSADCGFETAQVSLTDEAVMASGGRPGGVKARVQVTLQPGEPARLAATTVLLALLDVIEANLDGTLTDLDSEFLHDLRVSVRRSRAVQRELRRVFVSEQLRHYRTELRWLQAITGPTRDLDVYVLGFEDMRSLLPTDARADLDPVLTLLRKRRTSARRAMVRGLRSDRLKRLLSEWRGVLVEMASGPATAGRDAERPITDVAGGRISTVYRRMVKLGEAIGPHSPADEYHELRKQGKELRYLLELFGMPLYGEAAVSPMVRTLKSLQDVLGRHQDREIQVVMLQSLAGQLAAAPEGPEALMAMGMLTERLERDRLRARAGFAQRFAAFASKRQRRAIREMCG